MTGLPEVMTHQPVFFVPKYHRFAALFQRDDQLKSPKEMISTAIVLMPVLFLATFFDEKGE